MNVSKIVILGVSALHTLFTTLDPSSVGQALAFYELYSQSPEGKLALERAQRLLQTKLDVRPLANVMYTQGAEPLNDYQLQLVEALGSHFANRKLKGYTACNEEQVIDLETEEIDLAKALILSQTDDNVLDQARLYSAKLDLMALQISAYLPSQPTPEDKIAAINHFLFEQMHVKFPPHSAFAKDIDRYTFLASVMDDHLGVCLGVTAIYLCLAQRLDLPLEIITPPGHIFIRYRQGKQIVNIETTARGVDLPSETYLSVNTYRLQQRNLKEVIGMTHVNQASVYFHKQDYESAKLSYEKALPYLENDPLVCELLGYTYLFTGETERGTALLEKVSQIVPDYAISKRVLAEDYLMQRVDLEGIQAMFTLVDETRQSLLDKKQRLVQVLERCPKFRDGYFQLGLTWAQLNRSKEALEAFEIYHALNDEDPQGAYYLAVLHGERRDYRRCWDYLTKAEEIVAKKLFSPKALQELRQELCLNSPL